MKKQKTWSMIWTDELKELESSIQRVRELHKPYEDANQHYAKDSALYGVTIWCYECSVEQGMDEYATPYPCPTIKALDGEQE